MELKARLEINDLKSQIKLKDKQIETLKRKLKRKETEVEERNFRIQELSYLISKGLENDR